MSEFRPSSADELLDIVRTAGEDGRKLEVRGGGTKANFGAPRDADIVSLRGLSGVVDYDPAELVLTVRAGTPLAEVEQLLAERNQMLAFDPWQAGPVFGGAGQGSTVGGVAAAGVSGPARISGGAVRDHLLGFEAVSGRGEKFIAGAKVVKNVTGYDLSKLMAGSWGRLAALTQLTFKVLPRPAMANSVLLRGLADADAVAAMSAALASSAEVAAAAHLPPGSVPGGDAVTMLMVRGVEPSVAARVAHLEDVLAGWGRAEILSGPEGEDMWSAVREVRSLADAELLWRVILPPSRAAGMAADLPAGARRLYDWGGNLLWVAGAANARALREAARAAGGHAMLVRAPEAVRAATPALHPQPPATAALEERVRRAFDPLGIFETGRFPEAFDAD